MQDILMLNLSLHSNHDALRTYTLVIPLHSIDSPDFKCSVHHRHLILKEARPPYCDRRCYLKQKWTIFLLRIALLCSDRSQMCSDRVLGWYITSEPN